MNVLLYHWSYTKYYNKVDHQKLNINRMMIQWMKIEIQGEKYDCEKFRQEDRLDERSLSNTKLR